MPRYLFATWFPWNGHGCVVTELSSSLHDLGPYSGPVQFIVHEHEWPTSMYKKGFQTRAHGALASIPGEDLHVVSNERGLRMVQEGLVEGSVQEDGLRYTAGGRHIAGADGCKKGGQTKQRSRARGWELRQLSTVLTVFCQHSGSLVGRDAVALLVPLGRLRAPFILREGEGWTQTAISHRLGSGRVCVCGWVCVCVCVWNHESILRWQRSRAFVKASRFVKFPSFGFPPFSCGLSKTTSNAADLAWLSACINLSQSAPAPSTRKHSNQSQICFRTGGDPSECVHWGTFHSTIYSTKRLPKNETTHEKILRSTTTISTKRSEWKWKETNKSNAP